MDYRAGLLVPDRMHGMNADFPDDEVYGEFDPSGRRLSMYGIVANRFYKLLIDLARRPRIVYVGVRPSLNEYD
jgi:hypothetical protein